jgi:CBS domain-containing protein
MTAQPSGPMIENWVEVLRPFMPFSCMPLPMVRRLVLSAHESYAPSGAQVLGPEDGRPEHLYWLRQGKLTCQNVMLDDAGRAFELEAGSLWPIAALLSERPVSTRYKALEDSFYMGFPWATVQAVMQECPVFSDHLQNEAGSILRASRALLQQQLQQRWAGMRELEDWLANLPRQQVLMFPEETALQEVLLAMQARAVGSALLTDARGRLSGILTRGDVLGRITLPGLGLQIPAAQVMSRPVHTIGLDRQAGDAALLMAEHAIRHLPVVSRGEVVNIVTERDLFALQRQTLRHVSGQIRLARSMTQWQAAAGAIRGLTEHLMSQGVQPHTLTRLISQLNDRLTCSILAHTLQSRGLEFDRMCWIALGSEGRQEQTLATDQDNAVIFDSDAPDVDRKRWMACALAVNEILDACGYPLCRGGVMASRAEWCRTRDEWQVECAGWIEHARPQDLLRSAVFFDMRPLLGREDWVAQLRQNIVHRVKAHPLFLRQWVATHLDSSVALNWHGGLATREVEGQAMIDIKQTGTAIVVDAARILALGQGIHATSTRERLRLASDALSIPDQECRGWITAFEYLQGLRMKQTLAAGHHPNSVVMEQLDLVDRGMLKISFHAIDQLQQRLRMDYAL